MTSINKQKHYEEFYKGNDWKNNGYKVFFQLKVYLKLVKKSSKLIPYKILDVGCGTGIHTYWFNRLGYNCTGADFAGSAIEKARQFFPESTFLKQDACAPDSSILYDMLFVSGFSPFNTDEKKDIYDVLTNWLTRLKEKGVILIISRTDLSGKKSDSGWYFHSHSQIENFFSHPAYETTIYYAHPALRYLVLFPFFNSFIVKLVNDISKKIIAQSLQLPVRYIVILKKK